MTPKTKTFDAVTESRKWKEAVAEQTEGMSSDQVVAHFERTAVSQRFNAALRRAQQTGESETGDRK